MPINLWADLSHLSQCLLLTLIHITYSCYVWSTIAYMIYVWTETFPFAMKLWHCWAVLNEARFFFSSAFVKWLDTGYTHFKPSVTIGPDQICFWNKLQSKVCGVLCYCSFYWDFWLWYMPPQILQNIGGEKALLDGLAIREVVLDKVHVTQLPVCATTVLQVFWISAYMNR